MRDDVSVCKVWWGCWGAGAVPAGRCLPACLVERQRSLGEEEDEELYTSHSRFLDVVL